MAVSEFKARCTQVLRELAASGRTVEITSRGKVVAVVSPPPSTGENPAWGALRGAVLEIAGDFDQPLGDQEWEAAQ